MINIQVDLKKNPVSHVDMSGIAADIGQEIAMSVMILRETLGTILCSDALAVRFLMDAVTDDELFKEFLEARQIDCKEETADA